MINIKMKYLSKNTIYSLLILSILILIIILIFYEESGDIVKYGILILSLLLTFTHMNIVKKESKIEVKDVIKHHYELYIKPLQDKLKKLNKNGDIKFVNEMQDGAGMFDKFNIFKKSSKYKVVVLNEENKKVINDGIKEIKKGIQMLFEIAKKKENNIQKPYLIEFNKRIIDYAKVLKNTQGIDISESINENLGNTNKNIIDKYQDLNIEDTIVMTQSKIFAPTVILTKPIVNTIKNKFNTNESRLNLLELNKQIDNNDFRKLIVDLKTLNTNNITDNKMYLELVSNNNVNSLNSTIDIEWMNNINSYLMNLKIQDIYTIYAYTYKGDSIVNNYLRNNKKINNDLTDDLQSIYDDERLWIESYFPYYFQILNLIKSIDDFSNYIKETKDISYLNILNMYNTNNQYVQILLNNINESLDGKNDDDIIKLIKYENNNSVNYILISILCIRDYFNLNFWNLVLEQFSIDLDKIINNAPELSNYLITYRGSIRKYIKENKNIKKELVIKDKILKEGLLFTDLGFISTTIDIQNTLQFTNFINKCCLQRIILIPGTKCLPIFGISHFGMSEKEILLPTNSVFFVSNYSQQSPLYLTNVNSNYDNITNICPIDELKIQTNDLVIIVNLSKK